MNMSKGGNRGRNNQQQRRRRPRQQQQAPKGPVMTALGESTYEAVFDHGNEGYGIWFDGMVRDDPVYRRFWKGTGFKPLYIKFEEDQIVITREIDRELPPVNSADVDEPEAAADMNRVFTPEEAAEIFGVAEVDSEGSSTAEASMDPTEDADSDSSADEAPAKKPVTRRRATTPRKTTTRKRATSSDDVAED